MLAQAPQPVLFTFAPGCRMFSWGYVSRDFSPSNGVSVWESQLCCASVCIGWTRLRWNYWLKSGRSEVVTHILWNTGSLPPLSFWVHCIAVVLNRAAGVPQKCVICVRQMLPAKLRCCILKLSCRRVFLSIFRVIFTWKRIIIATTYCNGESWNHDIPIYQHLHANNDCIHTRHIWSPEPM